MHLFLKTMSKELERKENHLQYMKDANSGFLL